MPNAPATIQFSDPWHRNLKVSALDDPFAPIDLAPVLPNLLSQDPLSPAPDFAPVANVAAVLAKSSVGNGGAQAMLVSLATKTYGVSGAGVKIGILSDSFNVNGGYAAQVANGSLGAGVTILRDGPAGSSDEGQAMAEVIHQVAPNAQIDFYSAFYGEAGFATGIAALVAAGCNVIVDDVTYLTEPFFQTGDVIQNAVQAAINAGVSYFTSASNEGQNFYQASFTGVKTTLTGLAGTYLAENFGTTSAPVTKQSLTIAQGATTTIDLQWDQPFASIGGNAGAANSLGMVLYNSAGRIVAYATMNDVGKNPDQILQFTNTTSSTGFSLAIFTNGGSTAPGQFKYIVYGQGTTINDPRAGKGSGTLIGHEEVAAANVVGAVNYLQTTTYGGRNTVENFSSVGPGSLLFDASGNRLAQAASPGGVDFVAPDGTATSVFSTFSGTSAAAPNAAAVAALMLQANRNLTPAQVSADLLASGVSANSPNSAAGGGLIQAPTAVKLALASKTASANKIAVGTGSVAPATGVVATSDLTSAPTVASALDSLAADPTAQGDFYASIDPTVAALASAPPAGLGAGTSALAMLSNLNNSVPVLVGSSAQLYP